MNKKSIRTPILLVVLSLLVVIIVIAAKIPYMTWDGTATWTFHVSLLDDKVNKPIQNAKISIIVTDKLVLFAQKDTVSTFTDSSGVCNITTWYHAYGTKSLLKKTQGINFSYRALLAEAKGYPPFQRELVEIISKPSIKSQRCTTFVDIKIAPKEK